MFNKKIILITGGTGSFGKKFLSYLLENYNPTKVIIFSRDEMKQWEMQKDYAADERVRFFLGDIRDKDRLSMAFRGVDYVVHAAALKIVPTAEYNPFETVKTNINGTMNIIECALNNNVKKIVGLSTDKASSPINLYGGTKLVSDKLFVAGNAYSGDEGCKFSVVRYGNVIGSRGSLIPLLLKKKKENDKKVDLTDPKMTRFMIGLDTAIDLVVKAFHDMVGGEIYIKKIPSMNVVDIIKAIIPDPEITLVGVREGEKIHEQMVSVEEAIYTYEYDTYYKILPSINDWSVTQKRIKDGKKVPETFFYNSGFNKYWMTNTELLHEISLINDI